MHDRRSRMVALSICTALLAVTPAAAASRDARSAIEAAGQEFSRAVARGDAAALAAIYSAEAQVFPANSDIVAGRESIQQFWKGVIDSGVKGMTFTVLEVTARGDIAYEVGKYDLTGQDGKALDRGKYVVVWKREGGRWKLHRDMWNTSMPTPAR